MNCLKVKRIEVKVYVTRKKRLYFFVIIYVILPNRLSKFSCAHGLNKTGSSPFKVKKKSFGNK